MPRWLTTSAPMPPLRKALLPSTALSPRPAPARTSAWLTRSPKRLNDCFHFPPSRLLHDTSSANILRSSLWLMRGSYLLLCSFCSASFFSLAVFLYSFYLFLLLVPAGLILSCLSQKPVEESMYLHSQWDITNDNRFLTILESLQSLQTSDSLLKEDAKPNAESHPYIHQNKRCSLIKDLHKSPTSKTHQLWS